MHVHSEIKAVLNFLSVAPIYKFPAETTGFSILKINNFLLACGLKEFGATAIPALLRELR